MRAQLQDERRDEVDAHQHAKHDHDDHRGGRARLAREEHAADCHDDEEDDGAPPAVGRGHLAFGHAQRAHPHAAHAVQCRADGQEEEHAGHGYISPPGQQNLCQVNGPHLEVQLGKDRCDE